MLTKPGDCNDEDEGCNNKADNHKEANEGFAGSMIDRARLHVYRLLR